MPQQKSPTIIPSIQNHTILLYVALVCCLLFSLLSKAYAEQPTLKVGVSGRIYFQHVDEQGDFVGLDVELSELIFKEAGFNIQFIHYPWSRIIHLIELGKLDVALSAGESEERRKFALFSKQTLRQGQNLLFTLKDNAERFQGLERLSQLEPLQQRIAVYRGARYSPEYFRLLNEPWFSNNLVVLDSTTRTLESLVRGRSDALIGSEYGVLANAKMMGVTDQIIGIFPLMTELEAQTHIMYSKETVPMKWVDQIDAAMFRLKESGKYQKVISDFVESH